MTDRNEFRISESLLLAAIPVLAYGMAFVYEAAYLAAFNIPSTFVSVGVTTIACAMLATGLFGGAWYILTLWLAKMLGRKFKARSILCFMFSSFFIIAATHILLFGRHWKLWVAYVASAAILGLILVIGQHKSLSGTADSLAKATNDAMIEAIVGEMPDETSSRASLLRSISRVKIAMLALIAFQLIMTAYWVGATSGKTEDRFLVLDSNKEDVVVRIYADRAIVASIDPVTGRIGDRVAVHPLPGDSRLSMSWLTLGPRQNHFSFEPRGTADAGTADAGTADAGTADAGSGTSRAQPLLCVDPR